MRNCVPLHKMGFDLHVHATAITRHQNELLNGHKAMCIWFTGLSGSGKSTISRLLAQLLYNEGIHVFELDGDNTRMALNKDLGFSDTDRKENIRRVGEVCKLMTDAGLVVLATFISPFADDRAQVRQLLDNGTFIEIFVNCPLAQCEQRDPKGLYKKARSGAIKGFTGIDAPYEIPQHPELVIDSSSADPEESANRVVSYIKPLLKL